MSVNSVKISQIVLDGVLYDVSVSYKDASGDLFPIEDGSNFTLFSEDQSKKLHEFILKSLQEVPKTKSLSSYSFIKIDDQGVFSEGNEKLVDMAETISSIWKTIKADLIWHFENSTTAVVIPLQEDPATEVGPSQQKSQEEHEEPVTIEMSIQANTHSAEEENEVIRSRLEAAQDVGTSPFHQMKQDSNLQQSLRPQVISILEEASIKEVLGKDKTNVGYYKEIIDAVFNHVITIRKQTPDAFIQSLETVAIELRKNESDNSIKKEISSKLSQEMIEKLKEMDKKMKLSFESLQELSRTYETCAQLKDASTRFSEASFTNIIQANRR